MIAFMHIPRTGGSTFLKFAEEVYGRDVVHGPGPVFGRRHGQLADARRQGVRCYIAHMSYDPRLSSLDWVTIVRNPIRRIISHFYLKVERQHPEYVGLNIWDITNNHDWSRHHFGRNGKTYRRECGLNMITRMFGGGDGRIHEAIRNARQFRLIGHTDRYSQFIAVFSNVFGVPPTGVRPVNVLPSQPAVKDLPEECRQWLRKHNAADFTLMEMLRQEGLIA